MILRAMALVLCCLIVVSSAMAEDLVTNGSFEDPADGPPTSFTNWRRWQATPATAYRVQDKTTDGKWALFIKMDMARGSQVVQGKLKDYQPGQLYEIVFQALSAEPYDSFIVDILDRDASMIGKAPIISKAYTNTAWTQYSLRVTAPKEAGHPLYIRFYPRGPKMDSGVYVDDVHVFSVSEAAVKFAETYQTVELDTFNAITEMTFDLDTELDAARWRLQDMATHKAATADKLAPLQKQAEELADKLHAAIEALEALRADNLFPGIVLSALPDDEIATKTKHLEKLVADVEAAIEKTRAELGPKIAEMRERIDGAAPGWQPPAQRTASYSPKMLKDRFHRIISYHGYMPASEYLWRSMWELQPTAIQGYQQRDYRKENRAEFLRLNTPRTMPYIEQMRGPGWLFDLTETKAWIDAVFDDIGDDPAFSGFEFDEPGITDEHVTTPEGYAEFRKWLASRYADDVGDFPIAEALNWELPEKIEADFDQVMWMELQQFKTYWFAHRLKAIEDYIHSKDPSKSLLVVICQLLPTAPQWCSYVTTSAALDWIGMDPYNNANVGEALQMDLLRSNSKGPNLLVVGTCYDRTSGRFAKDMSISFAHCGGVWNWCWVYMAKHRAPAGVTRGQWPPKYRGYWKQGMYQAAQDIMGKMAVIEPYLTHTGTGANVGLVYSERTGIYCSLPDTPSCYISNLGVYQALQQLQIPTEALFAESMTPEKLAPFKCLILADAQILTDDESALLADWCRQGGSLILLGATATRDQWGRPHDDYGPLTELIGVKRGETKTGAATWKLDDGAEVKLGAKWGYDAIEPTADTAVAIGHFDNGDIAAVRSSFGKGQVVLLAGHNLGCSFDGSKYMKGMYKEYWPGFKENLCALVLDGVRDAGARLPVRAEDAPENVEVAVRKQGDRLVIHLLNYDNEGPVTGMSLIADSRAGQKAFYPADGQEIATKKSGQSLRIPVRDFEHHCCIVIEPR